MQIERVALPGIGISHVLTTDDGQHVGVICHLTGRRELAIYDPGDPQTVRSAVDLSPLEAHHLADLLHATVTIDHIADLAQQIPGISIGRLPITAASPFDGRRLGDTRARTRTGASIVAVIRDQQVISGPGPDFVFHHGDTVVAAGSLESITALSRLLNDGER